jgi:hypothetical protein
VVKPIELVPNVMVFVTVRLLVVTLDAVMLEPYDPPDPPPLIPTAVPVTVILENVALHAEKLLVENWTVV